MDEDILRQMSEYAEMMEYLEYAIEILEKSHCLDNSKKPFHEEAINLAVDYLVSDLDFAEWHFVNLENSLGNK